MLKINKKNYVWLLVAFIAFGCGGTGNQEESAGSAIEGLFGPSDKEKANSNLRSVQTRRLKNEADQMQKDRMDSYQ